MKPSAFCYRVSATAFLVGAILVLSYVVFTAYKLEGNISFGTAVEFYALRFWWVFAIGGAAQVAAWIFGIWDH